MNNPHIHHGVSSLAFPRDSYNPYQWALWQALEDAYYAHMSGFAHCRMPSGRPVDVTRFRAWQARTVDRWAYEANRDPQTRGLTVEDWPENLWLHMYERMLAAESLKPKVVPYTYED